MSTIGAFVYSIGVTANKNSLLSQKKGRWVRCKHRRHRQRPQEPIYVLRTVRICVGKEITLDHAKDQYRLFPPSAFTYRGHKNHVMCNFSSLVGDVDKVKTAIVGGVLEHPDGELKQNGRGEGRSVGGETQVRARA